MMGALGGAFYMIIRFATWTQGFDSPAGLNSWQYSPINYRVSGCKPFGWAHDEA